MIAVYLNKRKTLQPRELMDAVRLGANPVLVCNKTLDNLGIDSIFELGMYAPLRSMSAKDDGYTLVLDMTAFDKINTKLMGADWHKKGDSDTLGTSKEAGWWKPEESIWIPAEDFELEVVEGSMAPVATSPLALDRMKVENILRKHLNSMPINSNHVEQAMLLAEKITTHRPEDEMITILNAVRRLIEPVAWNTTDDPRGKAEEALKLLDGLGAKAWSWYNV